MKTAALGELEKKVMDILWKEKNSTARDILIRLERQKKLAYTTVATILQRLYDKGLLLRKENKAGYIYSPKLTKEKYSRNIAQAFLKNFINSFGDTAIASFADSIDNLPQDKRDYLLKLIDENDRNK